MSVVVRALSENAERVLREIVTAIDRLSPTELELALSAAEERVSFLSNEQGAPREVVLLADMLAETAHSRA